MKGILGFLRFLGNIALIGLAFYFLYWYIKMHFHPKWFWAFWLNTFISIGMYISHNRPDPERERIERMTGDEYWEEVHGKN